MMLLNTNSKQLLVLKDKDEKEMQATKSISATQENRRNSQARRKGSISEFGKKEKAFASKNLGYRFDFLNTTFKPITSLEAMRRQGEMEIYKNLIAGGISIDEMFEGLLNSYKAYAKIKNVSVEIQKDIHVSDGLSLVVRSMSALIPQEWELNIDYNHIDGPHFVLYHQNWVWDTSVFIIPMQIIDLLKEIISDELYNCLLDSISLLVYNASIPLYDDGTIDMCLEMMREEAENHLVHSEDKEEREHASEQLNVVNEYSSEKAKWYLKKLRRKNLKKSTIYKKVMKIHPKNGFEMSLHSLILQTLEIIRPGENLHNYDYEPASFFESIEDGHEAITIDRYISVGWSDDDVVINLLIEMLNNDYSEFGCNPATTFMKVTPRTKHDMVVTNWPNEFAEWHANFHRILTTRT